MLTIQTLSLVGHVIISLLIISLVFLQRGKGAEAGAAFGAGASGTVFGAKGSANFLSRSTGVLAALFFMSSLWLVYLTAQTPEETSLIQSSTETEVTISGDVPVTEGEGSGAAAELPGLPGAVTDGEVASSPAESTGEDSGE